MCLQTDDDRAGRCFYAGLVGVQHLEAIAEDKLDHGKGAGRHRMHNCGVGDTDLTVGLKADVFPERQCGTPEADNVHRAETESLTQKCSGRLSPLKRATSLSSEPVHKGMPCCAWTDNGSSKRP